MKPVYKASFTIDPEHRLEDVIAISQNWAADRFEDELDGLDGFKDGMSSQGTNYRVDTVRADSSGERFFGMRLTHPDSSEKGIEWRTEFAVAERKDRRKDVAINLEYGKTGRILHPIPTIISRPRLVPMIVDEFSPRAHFPLSTKPIPVDDDNMMDLVRAIQDKERQLPIVYAAASNKIGIPVLNVTGLASQLAGIAHVYADKKQSFELTRKLGRSMSCWDGALRIYWPLGTEPSDPRIHPYWKEIMLVGMNDDAPLFFLNYLADYTLGKEPLTSFEEARQAQQEQKIAGLRSVKDTSELLGLFEEENARLRRRVTDLEDSERIYISGQHSLQHRINVLQETLDELKKGNGNGGNGGNDNPELATEFRSVDDAVGKALEMYGQHLVFTGKARNGAKDSNYYHPGQIFKALEWLATTYRSMRLGVSNGDLEMSCKEQTGMNYASHQSKTTMGMYPDDYHVEWGGKKRELREHLSRGTSRDPRETVRIGFFFDKASGKIGVGYFGQHQKNRAS